MSLTWPQVVMSGLVFAAVLVAAKFVPEAITPVTSLAFTVIGSQFLNRQPPTPKENKSNA